jgi:hypothetical protein
MLTQDLTDKQIFEKALELVGENWGKFDHSNCAGGAIARAMGLPSKAMYPSYEIDLTHEVRARLDFVLHKFNGNGVPWYFNDNVAKTVEDVKDRFKTLIALEA